MACLLLPLVLSAGCASAPETAPPGSLETSPFDLIEGHETAFRHGERLRYSVHLLFLEIGEIVFETRLTKGPEGPLMHLRMVSSPKGLAAALSRYGGFANSWIDPATMLPHRYSWNNPHREEPVRRFNVFLREEGRVAGSEIEPDEWEGRSHDLRHAIDPACLLFVLRVLDLPLGETVRLDLVEGKKRRIATIRAEKDVLVKGPEGGEIDARKFSVRVDRVRDGELSDDAPETNMTSWVALEPERRILRSQGKMGGVTVDIRLAETQLLEVAGDVDSRAFLGPVGG